MGYDVGIADRLRRKGLRVKETEGWKSCGNSSDGSFYPKGFVRHHTAGAGPSSGVAPSLGTIINGRSDLPGPLANIYMDYDGVVYAIAAGAANHAGTPDGGSWKGCTGNSTAWGFEIEHPGTYALDEERAEIAAAATAAVIEGTCGPSMACDHSEWAPSRKIDLATYPPPGQFRDRVAYYLDHDYGGPAAVPAAVRAAFYDEEDEMDPWLIHETYNGGDEWYVASPSGLVRRLCDSAEKAMLAEAGLKTVVCNNEYGTKRIQQMDQGLRDTGEGD